MIFVVVAFSVIVQGGLVPTVAALCGVRMEDKEPRPWAVGMRLRDEPEHHRSESLSVWSTDTSDPRVSMVISVLEPNQRDIRVREVNRPTLTSERRSADVGEQAMTDTGQVVSSQPMKASTENYERRPYSALL